MLQADSRACFNSNADLNSPFATFGTQLTKGNNNFSSYTEDNREVEQNVHCCSFLPHVRSASDRAPPSSSLHLIQTQSQLSQHAFSQRPQGEQTSTLSYCNRTDLFGRPCLNKLPSSLKELSQMGYAVKSDKEHEVRNAIHQICSMLHNLSLAFDLY